MNDRFKFRVWNKREDCYIEPPQPTPLLQSDGVLAYFSNNPEAMNFYDIEFCTGLKDKNGNLIYEGDILFVKTLDWKNKEIWNAGEVKTYWSVEYKDYWNHRGFMVFGINRRFHKPLTRTTIFNSEAVIVGNIHKNKELLNER